MPEDVDEEAQALLGLGRQQLGVADVRDLVQRTRCHLVLHDRAQAVEVVGERAVLELGALDALVLLARQRALEHLGDALVLDHGRAVGVEDDDVARAGSSLPPISTGTSSSPGVCLTAPRMRT